MKLWFSPGWKFGLSNKLEQTQTQTRSPLFSTHARARAETGKHLFLFRERLPSISPKKQAQERLKHLCPCKREPSERPALRPLRVRVYWRGQVWTLPSTPVTYRTETSQSPSPGEEPHTDSAPRGHSLLATLCLISNFKLVKQLLPY